jgi:fructose-1,6-bisphosphatase-3
VRVSRPTPEELLHLRALCYRFPTVDSALAEAAHLRAVLALPKGTVHVVSDVHGEFKKLEHILRNASGSLRPLVERLFAERLPEAERVELLSLIYYPREKYHEVLPSLPDQAARERYVRTALLREFEVLRALAARYSLRHVDRVIAPALAPVFHELLFAASLGRSSAYLDGLLEPYFRNDAALELLRGVSRAIRALSVFELVVGGDLGDRGPRLDAVIEALRNQHSVAITFGNHDAEWMGACLGQEALIATVVRVSLRYGRVAQLEEGYAIPVEPVEQLARAAYGDDPCTLFAPKGEDLRDAQLLAQMQKAMAILQFKLEGQVTRRNPHFELEHRNLLHRIDPAKGTVTVDGREYPLLDTRFPTIDWRDPYALSPAEAACIAHLKRSFFDSSRLWDDMRFVARAGSMYLLRDQHVIFHGCVPVDEQGGFLSFPVDGQPRAG